MIERIVILAVYILPAAACVMWWRDAPFWLFIALIALAQLGGQVAGRNAERDDPRQNPSAERKVI